MKKIISFILMLTMLTSCMVFTATAVEGETNVWDGSVDTSWYTGNESATKFYISTAAELAGLASLVNAGTQTFWGMDVYLDANIYLNANSENYEAWGTTAPANNWTPIGTNSNAFKGRFDGQGNTIYGMYIGTANGDNQVGLFGCLNGNVVSGKTADDISCGIRNLKVVNSYIGSKATSSHNVKIGIIAGQYYIGSKNTSCSLFLSNVYTHGIVNPDGSAKTFHAAGMVGIFQNDGYGDLRFENLVSEVNVTSNMCAGGIAGCDNTASNNHTDKELNFINCVNRGNITISEDSTTTLTYAGGILGAGSSTTKDPLTDFFFDMSNCVNFGAISNNCEKTNAYAGGIVGYYSRRICLNNAFNAGTVSGNINDVIIGGQNNVGAPSLEITNAYTVGTVESNIDNVTNGIDPDMLDVYGNAYSDVAGLTSYVGVGDKITKLLTACGASLKEIGICAIQQSEDKTAIRFIAKLGSTDYSEVGFEVKKTEGGEATLRDTTTVYKSVYARDTSLVAYTAEQFGTEYLAVDGVQGIPTTGTATVFVRFYTKAIDSETPSYPDGENVWYRITIDNGDYQGYEKVELN